MTLFCCPFIIFFVSCLAWHPLSTMIMNRKYFCAPLFLIEMLFRGFLSCCLFNLTAAVLKQDFRWWSLGGTFETLIARWVCGRERVGGVFEALAEGELELRRGCSGYYFEVLLWNLLIIDWKFNLIDIYVFYNWFSMFLNRDMVRRINEQLKFEKLPSGKLQKIIIKNYEISGASLTFLICKNKFYWLKKQWSRLNPLPEL